MILKIKIMQATLFASLFMLVACNQNKSSEATDDFKVKKPSFEVNSKVITLEEGIYSQTKFHSEDLLRFYSPEAKKIQFDSVCTVESQTYKRKLLVNYQQTYKLLQLIPEKALKAVEQGPVLCDFDVTAFNENNSTHQFLLQRIEILITPESYRVKISKDLIDANEFEIIDEHEAYGLHLRLSPTDFVENGEEKKLKLICSDLKSTQEYDGRSFAFVDLLLNLVQTTKTLHTVQNCQIIQLVNRQVIGISKKFQLKLHRELFEVTRWYTEKMLKPSNSLEPLSHITLTNKTDKPMYFTLPAVTEIQSPVSWWFKNGSFPQPEARSAIQLESTVVVNLSFNEPNWVNTKNETFEITVPANSEFRILFSVNFGKRCFRRWEGVIREKLMVFFVKFANSPSITQVDFFGSGHSELQNIPSVEYSKLTIHAPGIGKVDQVGAARKCN